MVRTTFLVIALMLLALVSAYAADEIEVTNVEDNKGGIYQVTALEEGGLAFHDRDNRFMEDIPEEFLGLTNIQTSANCPAGMDYRLTFEIDRDAFIYTAWHSGFFKPEDQDQDPDDWFTDSFADTGKTMTIVKMYRIYKSKKPYPAGEVELFGIDPLAADPVYMWTIFFEDAGAFAATAPDKLIATWAEIKTSDY